MIFTISHFLNFNFSTLCYQKQYFFHLMVIILLVKVLGLFITQNVLSEKNVFEFKRLFTVLNNPSVRPKKEN